MWRCCCCCRIVPTISRRPVCVCVCLMCGIGNALHETCSDLTLLEGQSKIIQRICGVERRDCGYVWNGFLIGGTNKHGHKNTYCKYRQIVASYFLGSFFHLVSNLFEFLRSVGVRVYCRR